MFSRMLSMMAGGWRGARDERCDMIVVVCIAVGCVVDGEVEGKRGPTTAQYL